MKKVLIDFYADWCNPCKLMNPILDELEKEYLDLEIKKINVDEDLAMAQKYNISSIPTYILEIDGNIEKFVNGAMPKHRFIKELGLDEVL